MGERALNKLTTYIKLNMNMDLSIHILIERALLTLRWLTRNEHCVISHPKYACHFEVYLFHYSLYLKTRSRKGDKYFKTNLI